RAAMRGVGVAVEKVANGKSPDRQCHAVDVAFSSELKRAVRHLFLLAAEAEGLADEIALRAELRKIRTALLRFTIRKASQPERRVQAESLRQFRIEVELAAVPQPPAEKRIRRPCLSSLAASRNAVETLIGRAHARIPLRNKRGLPVNIPIKRFRYLHPAGGGREGRRPGRAPELIVQPDLDDVNPGIDVEVRKHYIAETIGPARQVDIVVFDLCSPMAD